MQGAYSENKYNVEVKKKKLIFVTIPHPRRRTALSDEDNNGQDKSSREKPTNDLEAYENVLVSKASIELADEYHAQAEVRDQNNLNMLFNSDFTGYGLQEVIENQLSTINSCMIKRPEPKVIELWIRLSAFAHWATDRDLTHWMMIDDSPRWSDTVAMIGYATIATLNTLDRARLLQKDSPIKDLGFVLALLGDFSTKCFDVAGGIPWISKRCEVCWPWKIVHYAKTNGIAIHGVSDIERNFVKKYDDEILVKWWNRKPCVDRWGWSTKASSVYEKSSQKKFILIDSIVATHAAKPWK
ncbi:hypothetical protein CC80DRAFT_510763 [Byssothecium circinans]|uniref:Uncharacterized protein n=1 Tax=Byssothecium circinans TaxID=147558 RepID=A0A6A5T823_9PLEO|nr:hypothetical protein CC80DRAFT_510763 [Byssothecium circinans]